MIHLPLRTAAADLHAATTSSEVVAAAQAASTVLMPHVVDGSTNAASLALDHAREIARGECDDVADVAVELASLLDEAAEAAGEYTVDEQWQRDMDDVALVDEFVQALGGSDDPDGDPWKLR